jgi:alanyl-tRNA synthetase
VLREVLGDHVRQAGSLVSPERLRFDFTHFAAIGKEDLVRIEGLVNQKARENLRLDTKTLSVEEALQLGAMALFGEKYGERVRVVMVSDFSLELCGGTHTERSGDIGLFKIVSESGVAAGVRRIEALTGQGAYEHIRKEEEELERLSQAFKASPGEIFQKADRLLQRQKELEREILSLQGRLGHQEVLDLLSQIKEIKGIKVLSAKVDGKDPKQMRDFIDQLKSRIGSGIVLLGGQNQNKVSLIVGVTPDLTRQYNASELIKKISVYIGGTGGGRPDFAQAGGTNSEKLDEAFRAFEGLI